MLRNIKEGEMFLLPVTVRGMQIQGLNEARAYVPSVYKDEQGVTFRPTGRVYPGDLEIQRRIYQQSSGTEGYAFANGPFEDRDVMKYDRIQADENARVDQLWISVKPVWRTGESR